MLRILKTFLLIIPIGFAVAVAREDTRTIRVNGLYNSGFEEIADGTTNPPKYGAYWLGAFSNKEGDSADLITQDAPFRGKRMLRLRPADGTVLQKVVADPRWSDRTKIILAVRLRGTAALEVTLEDGMGLSVKAVISGASTARWTRGDDPSSGIRLLEADGWTRVELDAGPRFARLHGASPIPRLNIRLRCEGPEGAVADVDEVYAAVHWPRMDGAALERSIVEKVLRSMETWLLPPEKGGLQLVDPKTGYVKVRTYDVDTGGDWNAQPYGRLHSFHEMLLLWTRFVREKGWKEEEDYWTPFLERIVQTLLDHNFDPNTHLPRMVSYKTRKPANHESITVGTYIDFLLEAREVITDKELKARCLNEARKTADSLIALQKRHDLPPDKVKNIIEKDPATGRYRFEFNNWFGLIPFRLTPLGLLDEPNKSNDSWIIRRGHTLWYHAFKTPASIMAVHAQMPRDGDMKAVKRALSIYRRKWDATRYDLEDDTDDHYGYHGEDLVPILKHSAGWMKKALELMQEATDHRLDRNAGRSDDTLWIQAVRLGTACAGDSPRAHTGLMNFFKLPPAANPVSSGLPLYREAILELARNDLKGRQLTNSQFTESFFKNWEMVCICYRGAYQGDCREHPPEYWQGDVGDTFGGPPTSAINSQACAYIVASPGERQQILSALGIIMHVTDRDLQREYGYAFGLDPAVARQYELPDKYVIGLSNKTAAGLGYVMAWLKLLPHLDTSPEPRLEAASTKDGKKIEIHGPPGGRVALPRYVGTLPPFPAPLSHKDARMAAFPLPEGWADQSILLDGAGRASLEISTGDAKCVVIQPILMDPAGGAPLALGEALVLRP